MEGDLPALLADAAGYLIDLDGTLISGRTTLPDAHWLLERVADRFMLVSNNSEHTPLQLSRHLRQVGLAIPPERIVLAGTAAIEQIARTAPGARVLLLGSLSLATFARHLGLFPVHEAEADIVLVTRDRHFNYAKLAMAAEALHLGARLVVACPDLSHPGPRRQPVPEAGALAAAVIAAGAVTRYDVVGKPEPLLFEIACRRLGIRPADGMMVGDNADTDGAGARRLGMQFLLVRGGQIRHAFETHPIPAE